MKHAPRLADYLEHMQQAAAQAIAFVEGMNRAAFLNDRRTQQAVILNLVILGEAAGNVLAGHPAFAEHHAKVPWRSIRATRNRLAHGYFDINLDVVWETVQTALPQLLSVLPAMVETARLEAAPGTPPPTSAV